MLKFYKYQLRPTAEQKTFFNKSFGCCRFVYNWGLALGRYEPSSKTCSNCGYRNSDLKLSDRQWECPDCGARHDRDFNAAVNIKSIGLGETKYSPTAGGFNGRGGGGYEAGETSKYTLV